MCYKISISTSVASVPVSKYRLAQYHYSARNLDKPLRPKASSSYFAGNSLIPVFKQESVIFVSMRWLCTILAFMVLMLSVQPVCADSTSLTECCSSPVGCKDDTDSPKQGTAESRNKDCDSHCNPFQNCSCCAFCVILQHQQSILFAQYAPLPNCWNIPPVHFSDEPVTGVWQPPKIY